MHQITDLLKQGQAVSVDPEYPFWIRPAGAPYPFDIAHFKRFRHPWTLEATGLTTEQLDEVYNICALLNGGDHSIVLATMEGQNV